MNHVDEDEVEAMRAALKSWRTWAQFVWLGGGPVTVDDDELRRRICQAADIDVAEATPERQAYLARYLAKSKG
jgi:hypothetical protein